MNKSVLVTGASRGIGKAIAIHLAKLGYDIALNYRTNTTLAEEVADTIMGLGVNCRLLPFDVGYRDQCAKQITQDTETHGAYYAVVCNAGITADNPFPALTGEDWDTVIHTNLDGFYNVLQPIIMPMIQRRKPGRIVTLSSISGLMGNRGQVNYSAAKAGIIGATKALAVELAKRNITVNCVAPGLIESDMVNNLPLDDIKKTIPAQRIGKPEEVAALVGFLLSDDAGYITRQVISVNGGLC